MTKVKDLEMFLNKLAPLELKEDKDNVGFLVGNAGDEITSVMVALDITEDVIEEAKAVGANVIVSHHPVIYYNLNTVTDNDFNGRRLLKLIKYGMSALCYHTNLDIVKGGVNDTLAAVLGLKKVKGFCKNSSSNYKVISVYVPKGHEIAVRNAMSSNGAGMLNGYEECAFMSEGKGSFRPTQGTTPFIGEAGKTETVDEIKLEMICSPDNLNFLLAAMIKAHPYEVPAYSVVETSAPKSNHYLGRMGECEKEYSPKEFANYVKNALGCDAVRYSDGGKPVRKVALIGGSAAKYFPDAIREGADAFVTAECKYFDFMESEKMGLTLIDAGHFCTENVIVPVLAEKIAEEFKDIKVHVSKEHKDCIKYL